MLIIILILIIYQIQPTVSCYPVKLVNKPEEPMTNPIVTSPKKLLLKPHVGSPETTYTKSDCDEDCEVDTTTKTKKKVRSKSRDKENR